MRFANPILNRPGMTRIREGGVTGRVGFFGLTRVDGEGEPRMHKGIDLLAAVGQPVFAVEGGEVVRAGWEDPKNPYFGYGLRVTINHGDGYETRYAHLSKVLVQVGDYAAKGSLIGTVGRTGNAHGLPDEESHLHFEIRAGGTAVDPVEFIA